MRPMCSVYRPMGGRRAAGYFSCYAARVFLCYRLMKTRFMQRSRNPFRLILAGAAVLEGCAPFDHHPGAQEPCAVVAFVDVSEPFPDQAVVKTFDGPNVKIGRDHWESMQP
jgi:hypothetical protein